MTWLFEQPLVIIGIGGAILLVLFGVLQQTGKHAALYAMIAVAILFAGLLLLERMTVTPAEAVRQTIYEVAAAAQRNDAQAVVEHISNRTPETKAKAAAVFKAFRLEEVKVKQIDDLKVRPEGNPPTATARVLALAVGGDAAGTLQHQRLLREFTVNFVQEDGHWRVRSYEDTSGDNLVP